MKELSDEEILFHLEQDTIGRNGQLSVLMKLLNGSKDNTVLAIDGSWGSGKTVFVKQLAMLTEDTAETYNVGKLRNIDLAALEDLRKKHDVIYFNAWENDYSDDPLGMVLLALISKTSEKRWMKEESIKRGIRSIDAPELIKRLSMGGIDVSRKSNEEQLTVDVKQATNRKALVDTLLGEIIKNEYKEKSRILFIIDELDRCKPSFAVELLEIIKHYFTRDDITFIFSTNLQQLAHTVNKYYGYSFDGYSYLNRFFGFSYHLKRPNLDQYARLVHNWQFSGGIIDGIASDAIKHFNFQMREINAYLTALRLVDSFTKSSRSYGDKTPEAFVKWLLAPFALAVKIRSISDFNELVNGTKEGEEVLKKFVEHSSEMQDFVQQLTLENINTETSEQEVKELQLNELLKLYRYLFSEETMRYRAGIYMHAFQEAMSLLGQFTAIVESEEV